MQLNINKVISQAGLVDYCIMTYSQVFYILLSRTFPGFPGISVTYHFSCLYWNALLDFFL